MPSVTGLGHVGLYVDDVDKMVDFYSKFLGLKVTDQASDGRITFLSARPGEEHHELALAHNPELKTNAQQISFTVGSLADLKTFYSQIKAENMTIDRVINHGNAFGCYFRDPENNRVEVYWHTGRDYPQPHGDSIDLDMPEQELMAAVANMPAKEHEVYKGVPASVS
jgi:catechol-2,3-dioxygenase